MNEPSARDSSIWSTNAVSAIGSLPRVAKHATYAVGHEPIFIVTLRMSAMKACHMLSSVSARSGPPRSAVVRQFQTGLRHSQFARERQRWT